MTPLPRDVDLLPPTTSSDVSVCVCVTHFARIFHVPPHAAKETLLTTVLYAYTLGVSLACRVACDNSSISLELKCVNKRAMTYSGGARSWSGERVCCDGVVARGGVGEEGKSHPVSMILVCAARVYIRRGLSDRRPSHIPLYTIHLYSLSLSQSVPASFVVYRDIGCTNTPPHLPFNFDSLLLLRAVARTRLYNTLTQYAHVHSLLLAVT